MARPMSEEDAAILAEAVAKARRVPPRFERIAPPLDAERLLAFSDLYDEEFDEALKRMRLGLDRLEPRE